ncbi:hypothetical protein OROGR_022807 [Orobanche gracilis]
MHLVDFVRLCVNTSGLEDEKYVRVTEQVALFLHVLAHHKKNVSIKLYYKRSRATVSRYFNRTLDAFLRLYHMFLAHPKPITEDSVDPVWKYFPGCLGALDGTHVKVRMENQAGMQIPQGKLGRGRRQKSSKRFWSKNEELVCIGVVKELIKGGWRSGNGWPGGFYGAVRDEMKKVIPDCTLTDININSKLTVWKREWIMVFDVAKLSGFNWDRGSNMVLDETNELWNSLKQNGNEAEKIRGNTFPYYEDWCEIFGKDRATGEKACDFAANEKPDSEKRSVEKMEGEAISRTKEKDKISGYDTYFTDCYFIEDEDGDSNHVNIVSPTAGGGNKKKKSENSCVVDDSLNVTMNSFMNDTKEALLGLNKSIEKLCDGMDALKNIHSLSQVHRIEIAEKLMDKSNHLQLFVAMDDDDQFGY